MKVHLDGAKCEGHGLCYTRTDLFDSDDEGHAVLLVDGELADDQVDLAQIAERSCPVQAISVSDD